MSSENSAQKWLIGCLIAGFVGVLLCGGVMIGVGLLGFRAAEQVARELGPELKRQGEIMQFANAWNPPSADAGAQQLVPDTVSRWRCVSHDDNAAIVELGLALEGQHGAYESDGVTINAYVYRLPLSEQAATFDGAISAIDSAGYSSKTRNTTDYGNVRWVSFGFAPPDRFGRMWWAKDWLIVAITDSSGINLEEFVNSYALAIQGTGAPPVSEPVSADAPAAETTSPDSKAIPDEAGQDTAPDEPPPSADTAPADPASTPENPDAAPGGGK